MPCFNPEDPIDENDKAITAIRMLVEQPAVINADRVVVSSEKVKDVYYKRAIELCGAETEMYWQQMIVTTNEYVGDAAYSENADVHLTCGTDIDKPLAERFSQLLVKAAGISNIVVDRNGVASSHVSQCSAFYGDRGALQKSFAEVKIPVMIQNVDV